QKLKVSDFCDHLAHEATGKDEEENADLLAGEIESLESILTKQEVQTIEVGTKLNEDEVSHFKIVKLLHFSIAPNFTGKILAEDKMQKTKVELRKLPLIEFYAALTCDYPSVQAPLFCVKDGFYTAFKKQIALNMSKLWSEGMPCLYDVFIYIQDSLV
ncbi:MAG: hypothetical protein ACK521_02745, partial [bacterium]